MGLIPQEPYPGKALELWRHRCAECGYEVVFSLSRIRKGARCHHTRARRDRERARIMKMSGFQPVKEFPATKIQAVLVRCVRCGRERYRPVNWMEAGGKCLCAKIPGFLREMREAGYAPEVPYPGTARQAWRSKCCTCGATRWVSLETVRAGKLCQHGWKRRDDVQE